MSNLPTHPPVAVEEYLPPTVYGFGGLKESTSFNSNGRTFIQADHSDWEIKAATSLANAVPANVEKTTITIHRHQIIVERQDGLYRFVSKLEDLLVIASTCLLIGVSGISVAFALSAIANI